MRPDAVAADRAELAVRRMAEQMKRRGPDAEGYWSDGVAFLAHRRLAIIDLDPRSNQPFVSAGGRFHMVFNGEIYNYHELRAELVAAGVPLRTSSDTEVVVELFARDGVQALERLRGMYAIAVWDDRERRLLVARDPYGIKPLYLADTSSGVVFASQVKAIARSGLVQCEVDPDARLWFWLTGSVPEPRTWFRGVQALPPGSYAWVSESGTARPVPFWDIGDDYRREPASLLTASEARAHLREAMSASIAAHLVSDVPVAVLLSGGIDSGVIAALAAERSGPESVAGVTIAFDEFAGTERDESPDAALMARHLGIRHHVRRVSRREFEDSLPQVLEAMDQPSVDGINTWLATMAAAEQGFKVILSGVGGDELLQGYSHFRRVPGFVAGWSRLRSLPGSSLLGVCAANVVAWRTGNARWRHAPDLMRSLPGAWLLRRGLLSPEIAAERAGMTRRWNQQDVHELAEAVSRAAGGVSDTRHTSLSLIESRTYLRNQLLRDSDWASMDHSVELRTPLVDAWLLRQVATVLHGLRGVSGKSLLCETPARPLPLAIVRRTKTGFGLPLGSWLGGGNDAAGIQAWAATVVSHFDGLARAPAP